MMRRVGLAVLMALAVSPACAQGLRCSAFLHQNDGGWRAFSEGEILGPDGPVHLRAGEVVHPAARSEKGNIARALNDLCGVD